ncbi:uncharacterized protein FRV6_16763 [Fusarium oxysporum]|uniref:Zn(2)-C6 fungal-type domain-containing protein n=1 Tax=Fusarium oxysporum TaxID=5507 RepID=A0A2H3TYC5_FUSOX|nr:uncharacterized protein FRV6_16763 [Fusarium oxysporum]
MACDLCKLRKVKCDMTEPCSNCRMSQLSCAYSARPQKRGRKPGERTMAKRRQQQQQQLQQQQQQQQQQPSPQTPLPEPDPAVTLQSRAQPMASSCALSDGEEGIYGGHIPGHIYQDLMVSFKATLPSVPIVDVVTKCIDLFMQYLFPITPVVHECTLRSYVSLFQPQDSMQLWGLSSPQPSSLPASLQPPSTWSSKAFTAITALCASVASVVPDPFLDQRHAVSTLFLKASRAMHQTYHDHDLEHPDSSSLLIRMWHSAALQNTTGTTELAWHSLWEANLIVCRLRLYDEKSVTQIGGLESQLLRASFWQLHSADRAACALENRPYVLGEHIFPGGLTLLEQGEHDGPLLDDTKSTNRCSLESRLLIGFRLKCSLWLSAGNLIADINSYIRRKKLGIVDLETEGPELVHLTESYLAFSGIVDHLPIWLQCFNNNDGHGQDADVSSYQATCFWVQRINLMTTFHCLRLTVLQKCIEHNVLVIMGLENIELSLAIKKIEIVHDFLQELQMAPFECFKVLGEATVSDNLPQPGPPFITVTDHNYPG